MTDYSDIFQDPPFPGRKLLSWSVGITVLTYLLSSVIYPSDTGPEWLRPVQIVVLTIAFGLYMVGYWNAVVGKGYSRVLFAAALAPVIGLFIIYFLPTLHSTTEKKNQPTQSLKEIVG